MEQNLILQALQKNSKQEREPEPSKPKIDASVMAMAIQKRANEAGFQFLVDSENEKPLTLVCQYFANDPDFEKEGLSLKKGLMLFGNTGCGKTSLMKLCSDNLRHYFGVVNCRKVASDFAIDGDEGIERYYRTLKMNGGMLGGYCFDDFGSEPIKVHFGSKIEVMEDIMLRRYDMGRPFYTTHITTNKTTQEIRDRYGDRLADRFREMFNIIEFPTNAKSRRV